MPERDHLIESEHESGRENAMPVFDAAIRNIRPENGILATADVRIADLCTIRNVKIKEDDYGRQVIMPRTKTPLGGSYKDACFFDSRNIRGEFDRSVLEAYEQEMNPELEYDEDLEDEQMDEYGPEEGGAGEVFDQQAEPEMGM